MPDYAGQFTAKQKVVPAQRIEADLSPGTQLVFFLALGKYLFGPFTPTDNREEVEPCEYLESTPATPQAS
jgi:hypothetical protein